MAIQINELSVSPDGSTINLSMETSVGQTFTKLELWTEETYPNVETIEDVSQYLTKVNNVETLTIPVENLGLNHLYFFNVQDSESDNHLAVTVDFLVFYSCSIDVIINNYDECSCNYNKEIENVVMTKLYTDALRDSLLIGDYQNSITLFNTLNKICDI
jgi:hypothetical protein